MKKNLAKYAIIAVCLGLLGLAVLSIKRAVKASKDNALKKDLAAMISPAAAKREINKEIAVTSAKAKLEVKYMIISAEILEEIIVKGEKVKAAAGRAFLIFNLKVINNGRRGVQVNSRDFVRLAGGGSEEWLAPDVHNDPVEVQALSTKYTRLGFVINTVDKLFKVRIGEINGEKEELEIQF